MIALDASTVYAIADDLTAQAREAQQVAAANRAAAERCRQSRREESANRHQIEAETAEQTARTLAWAAEHVAGLVAGREAAA